MFGKVWYPSGNIAPPTKPQLQTRIDFVSPCSILNEGARGDDRFCLINHHDSFLTGGAIIPVSAVKCHLTSSTCRVCCQAITVVGMLWCVLHMSVVWCIGKLNSWSSVGPQLALSWLCSWPSVGPAVFPRFCISSRNKKVYDIIKGGAVAPNHMISCKKSRANWGPTVGSTEG